MMLGGWVWSFDVHLYPKGIRAAMHTLINVTHTQKVGAYVMVKPVHFGFPVAVGIDSTSFSN